MFFSLKLHKLPYLKLFICFNNILKKISFSGYIKWNTSHFNEKIYISLRKRIFECFCPFVSMFWMKMKEKSKKYINFTWQFIFFSQSCINYPVSSVSWRINIFSKKDHLYFSTGKRNICNFTKKSIFSPKKLIFWWFFAYFIVFIKQ